MRKILLILAALAAAAPGVASAEPQPAPSAEAAPLAVRFTETNKDHGRLGLFGPYYPQIAVDRRVTGSALIDCAVGPGGALDRCAVVQETPPGVFFGAAAKRMAESRWIAADPANGLMVGATARFLVPFAFAAPKAR